MNLCIADRKITKFTVLCLFHDSMYNNNSSLYCFLKTYFQLTKEKRRENGPN